MKPKSAFSATAVALALVLGACSSGSGTGSASGGSTTTTTGGSSGGSGGGAGSGGAGKGGSSSSGGQAGGSSGSGGASTCNATANVTPCGGDVAGTWTVTPSCLKVSGELDLSGISLGCASAPVTGSRQVTGTWTVTSAGKYVDNTTTTGSEQFTLAAPCLIVSSTPVSCPGAARVLKSSGYSDITCTDDGSGGCSCVGNVQQTGGLGLMYPEPSTSGNYTTSGNVVSMTEDSTQFSYCVSGNKMTWTPKSTSPTITGTIVFTKGGGAGGAGGVTTQGGQSGSGAGGVSNPGSGGNAGSGGQTAKGGAGGTAGADAGRDAPPGSGGAATGGGSGTGTGGNGSGGSSTPPGQSGPCDIYAAASPATPCVAAYSMVMVLSSTYSGALYQVRSGSSSKNTGTGGSVQDIMPGSDGFAVTGPQDTFCNGTTCTVSIVYDQSGKGNHLKAAPAGNYTGTAAENDYESIATKQPFKASGHTVYALYVSAHGGYRDDAAKGLATGSAAQGIYEIVDGSKNSGTACCFDFGNVRTDNKAGGTGTMATIYFGTGFWGSGVSPGPWFLGDFENGVWAGGSGASSANNTNLPSSPQTYAFGIVKTSTSGSTGQYAIRVGDAQSGTLKTAYDGQAPAAWSLSGAVVLGVGGDNSNSSTGTFYEGVITAGRPSDATDALILTNVQAANFGK